VGINPGSELLMLYEYSKALRGICLIVLIFPFGLEPRMPPSVQLIKKVGLLPLPPCDWNRNQSAKLAYDCQVATLLPYTSTLGITPENLLS